MCFQGGTSVLPAVKGAQNLISTAPEIAQSMKLARSQDLGSQISRALVPVIDVYSFSAWTALNTGRTIASIRSA